MASSEKVPKGAHTSCQVVLVRPLLSISTGIWTFSVVSWPDMGLQRHMAWHMGMGLVHCWRFRLGVALADISSGQ